MRSNGRDAEEKMRSAVSCTLITSLIASAVPVAAQQNRQEVGPITRSITREAARFATVQQSNPVDSQWSRVRKLAPGTELIVIVKGAQRPNRYFVVEIESDLTVLNVDDAALTSAARDVLRRSCFHPSGIFSGRAKRRTVCVRERRAHGADGVFVADRKVADLAQVVERYGRSDITEIRTAIVESNPVGCAFGGFYGGGIVGGLPGAVIGGAVGRDTGPALLGMMVGWFVGAVYVYGKCRHKPEKVIYDAP
jgi:hypothetical protein